MGSKNEIFLSIAAPVYNEQDTIAEVIRYWDSVLSKSGRDAEIVVTNDGSTDNTLSLLRSLQEQIPRLHVVTYEKNKGYGGALSSSIQASRGKYILTIDSDGQFDAAEYNLLLEEMEKGGFDVVTGFRKGKKDTLFKVFCDRALNCIIRVLFGIQLRDTNCALKLAKSEYLKRIRIESMGYPAPTEIVIKSFAAGARIGQVGITHHERKEGISKLRPIRTGINMFRFLLYLRSKINLYKAGIITEVL